MSALRIALCGNPNVGKSTVFNALTGLRQHTGNWAGKTVDTARGQVRGAEADWTLTDLPGAYSLLSGSPEEMVASDCLTFEAQDAVIVVCDATCLERNLNLALQAAEACPRMVLCINMMDEARARGMEVNAALLEQLLGLPAVGISARNRQGLNELKRRVEEAAQGRSSASPSLLRYPGEVEQARDVIEAQIKKAVPAIASAGTARFAALRALAGDDGFLSHLLSEAAEAERDALRQVVQAQKSTLERAGFFKERLVGAVISEGYRAAGELCRRVVSRPAQSAADRRQLRIDRLLASRLFGIPLMLALLGLVLYLTLSGANVPSAWLSETLGGFEPKLAAFLTGLGAPAWLVEPLVSGVYRVTSWVISVMLPPMAIFFPLFTLLEDLGFLPRVAFNLDRCFQRCHACGKQALCMCMGLGCNAVGVMGCRIIQSPRERLIAILTNALMPCNGRFPTLIALISMFFVFVQGPAVSLAGAAILLMFIVLCVGVTLGCSRLLSATLLKGMPSAFALELPPFRRPKVGQVLIRSVLDRTMFVLGRAVTVAAPAGLVIWLLANLRVGDTQVLRLLADALEPAGRFLGMDGVILLAFILGFPANEIVLPIMLMTYLCQGTLVETQGLDSLRALLVANGWTLKTAACVALFSLFHWPCSTTTLTVYKETRSLKWTAVAVLLPTLAGAALCALTAGTGRLLGL
ncbi:MAG TPA: ferrous iron transport protein B [Candidatus Limiplasma pullistercoris]|nr:ferrous iron transport protein B [Candidatus Limiplasma pullistercoris]